MIKAPTITLAMIVRNVEAIISKCLASVIDHHAVDEVIIVDTGSTDKTLQILETKVPWAKILHYNPTTHPQSFLLDAPETWWEEKLPGPWTGKQILANFGEARQLGMNACKSDYVMWLDSDDVLTHGEKLRDVVRTMAAEGHETAMVKYDYETDDTGQVVMTLIRERIVKRRPEVVWCQPIHEVLCPTFNQIAVSDIIVTHQRRQYGLPAEFNLRNLKVLLHWFRGKKEEDVDPRMLFYLAMEETWLRPDDALRHYRIYCEKSGSEAERAKAHVYAGRIHELKKENGVSVPNYGAAFSEYAQATLDASYDPDPWFNAARIAYYQKRYDKCVELTEKGYEANSGKHGRVNIFQYNPVDRDFEPLIYYSISLQFLGRYREALDACNKGLAWRPDDPHLLGNKQTLDAYFAAQEKANEGEGQIVKSDLMNLTVHQTEPLDVYPQDVPQNVTSYFAMNTWKKILVQGGEEGYRSAETYLNLLPKGILFNSKKKEMLEFLKDKKRIQPPLLAPLPADTGAEKTETSSLTFPSDIRSPVKSGKLDIIFHVGASWEHWSPKTVEKTGIGGSETAVICMAKELATLGHRVTVLSDCAEKAGVYDGVYYIDYQRAETQMTKFDCDVFISSRQPWVLDKPWKFRLSILWVHDTHVGQPSLKLSEQLFNFDRFFCLSRWHRNFFYKETYPFLSSDRVIQTRNGLDTSRFTQNQPVLFFDPIQKKGNRMIYSSSPDRGLETLIKLLPRIRQQVPDAKLHVYYGFDTWRKMAESARRRDWLEEITRFQGLIDGAARAGDLEFHGRVNQNELAQAFLDSKVWAYPSAFHETSCISALEAQAAGCVPVTTRLAALPETVHHGILLDPPNTTTEYCNLFVENIVKLLTDEDYRQSLAVPARAETLQHSDWRIIANEWERIFQMALQEKIESPLPAFGDF